MKSLINLIDFPVIGDVRGSLVALESYEIIPFEIKRVYYLYGMSSELPRGFHAHKELMQVAICLNGSCDILMDNGFERCLVTLNAPNKGLVINTMQWHEMSNFSDDCVLLVLASDLYDENDYIRDYKHFLDKMANKYEK